MCPVLKPFPYRPWLQHLVNIFSFVGCLVSTGMTEFCHCNVKTAIYTNQIKHKLICVPWGRPRYFFAVSVIATDLSLVLVIAEVAVVQNLQWLILWTQCHYLQYLAEQIRSSRFLGFMNDDSRDLLPTPFWSAVYATTFKGLQTKFSIISL